MRETKTVLVLGAYGFIGASVVRRLRAEGIAVRGLVRNLGIATRVLPDVELIQADLRTLTQVHDWQAILREIEIVVNCSGALQDGGQDDLRAVHQLAIAALGQACTDNGVAIIQVSAIGASPDATTTFMRSKAEGDAALRASGAVLWVLRPGLVIGQSDYGGTALLRMLAAVPVVQPVAYPQAPVQCVGMEDLCTVILSCVQGDLPEGDYDLVEDSPHTLAEVLAATRHWLGFSAARRVISVPSVLTKAFAGAADQLARLGWRSPLRSTAITVMEQGVVGDPEPFRAATGRSLRGLSEIYDNLTCAREHRLSARMTLLMPVVIGALCLFWLLSGLFGLTGLSQASEVLIRSGWSAGWAGTSVVLWSLVDIALGMALLWRPWAARVCLAQAAVAAFYLIAATLFVPALWLDPLGPLLKVIPALLLSVTAIPMLESR